MPGISQFCTIWIRARGLRLWPSNCTIHFAAMRLILCLALTANCISAQQAARKLDSLHDLSANLEALSHRVSRSVVQIFATGYALSESSESGGAAAAMITRQRA